MLLSDMIVTEYNTSIYYTARKLLKPAKTDILNEYNIPKNNNIG